MLNAHDFLRGVVRAKIICFNPENFISKLRVIIPVKGIKKLNDNEICFEIYSRDKKALEALSKSENVTLTHIYQYGLPYIVLFLKRRIGLTVGAVLGMMLIYISSLMIWEIQVKGINKLSHEGVISALYELGFHEGVFKSSVDQKTLQNRFMMKVPEAAWMAVNFEGTVASVEINEVSDIPPKADLSRNANIVADCDGEIVKIQAADGQIAVNLGDVVSKGQLLINAFVETRHSGAMLKGARGSVWAKTNEFFEVTLPTTKLQKKYTGKTKSRSTYMILGKELSVLTSSIIGYYDVSKNSEYITLLKKIKLPIRKETTLYREYELYTQSLTQAEALNNAKKLLDEQINAVLDNCPIASKKYYQKASKDKVTVGCEVECIRNIAKYLDFDAK